MSLNLPAGASCFVDANILVYDLVELGIMSGACRDFLREVNRRRLEGFSTGGCLADAVHRIMVMEAMDKFGLAGGAVRWLQRNPDRIGELTGFREAGRQIVKIPLRLLTVDASLISEASDLSARHGLLTNDATIVALMQRHGLVHLVTNDDDFDSVPGITVWKPR